MTTRLRGGLGTFSPPPHCNHVETARPAWALIHSASQTISRRPQFPLPAVILPVDLRLPRLDGMEVWKLVKTTPATARCRWSSATSDAERIRRPFLAGGRNGFLLPGTCGQKQTLLGNLASHDCVSPAGKTGDRPNTITEAARA